LNVCTNNNNNARFSSDIVMCNYCFIYRRCQLLRCRYCASDTDSKTSLYSTKYLPQSATLSITKVTWTSFGRNPIMRSDKLETKLLAHQILCSVTLLEPRYQNVIKEGGMYGTTDLKIARQIKVRKDINRSLLKDALRISYTTGNIRIT